MPVAEVCVSAEALAGQVEHGGALVEAGPDRALVAERR
ncbi:hypothetical protein JOF29_003946 [Kribbella aluminosa]|uniref:Uncharacterized protein n=1 Tax=Kribbella aluminosa TaxID=416017 RepID=A0ABS4UMH6_9ACTN|nr:hypothetical protein [Kribbella aluminosa]